MKYKKALSRAQVVMTSIILLALTLVTFGATDTSSNDSSLDQAELNSALLEAFENLNLSLTNVYVNETYLNQTFITNEQYTTNVDNRTFNEFITQVTNNYVQGFEPIAISTLDSITLSDTNYSEIDFYVRNSMISSITDTNSLDLATSLENIINPNFETSFFINPDNNNLVTNNIIVNDGNVNNQQDAFLHDNSNSNALDLEFNTNLGSNKNMYVNLAYDWNDAEDTFFEIHQNDVPIIGIGSEGSREIIIRDMINNYNLGGTEISQACDNYGEFCLLRFEFEDDVVNTYFEGQLISTFDNEFNDSVERINFVGNSQDNEDAFVRSLYIQQDEVVIQPATYSLDSQSYTIDSNEWTNVNIRLISGTAYYQIGNQFANIDYTGNYELNINLTQTDVANLFAKSN